MCSHNASRSQLAAALLRHRAVDRLTVSSAGAHPGPEVGPHIAQVLTEAGADPAGAFPKPLTDEAVRAADIVITMGCGDACPIGSGRRCLDWPVPDPDGAPLGVVRQIRDDIDMRITDLPASLVST
ncbi:low molecular weight phosphatase family protein [Streptomyces sp. NPDC058534]|uniref:arsenate-mycothiol transferase ArsC n=1 Tax=Streptomyces sp. NPDC058534 TaxID=3346541 RepID=UPI00364C2B84